MATSKIVECVPNFSEGRNKTVIDAISMAIKNTDGCTLLNVESGESTNRSVYTFVGSPSAVVQGALNAAKTAHTLIDMSKHKGEHPRMGAMDVCPFIPVRGVSEEECIKCSKDFGSMLSQSLQVPVFLYEDSAVKEYRRSLAQIRSGEYEGLKDKLSLSEWEPDFGSASFVPSWGATVTGARKFLIAYNVNLIATKEQANRIGFIVRERGRYPEQPGLKSVKALGWTLEEKGIVQVSMNLTDYETTPIHVAYEECVKNAAMLNIPVVGSEIVGMVPLKSLLMVAEHYIEKENLLILEERHKIMLAIERLGLNSISQFDPNTRIIEYSLSSEEPLLDLSLREFIEALGARTSAPGGGSASACIASMGVALSTMVGLLTYGKRQYDSLDSVMRPAISALYQLKSKLMRLVDQDTKAFNTYMAALKLPKNTEEEKVKRSEAMVAGLKEAISIPLSLMRLCNESWQHLLVLAEKGNVQTMSDLQVAVSSVETGVFGGYCNVMVNLKDITDEEYKEKTLSEAKEILDTARVQAKSVLAAIELRLQ